MKNNDGHNKDNNWEEINETEISQTIDDVNKSKSKVEFLHRLLRRNQENTND